ncbi:MAG: TVP38/TMEM64 family protein [Thermodesulfobacteriota bacterium]
MILMLSTLAVTAGLAYRYGDAAGTALSRGYTALTDQNKIREVVLSFGPNAPLMFIALQILQVLIAPLPGEATGFIGGYLFGYLPGFLYSTIGLTVGSFANFFLGRFLGNRLVRRLIPEGPLGKFEVLLKKQGFLIVFILFLFPGFPKDYLCLFLGMTRLPLKAFAVISTVGRVPGTLLLSLQGAFLQERMVGRFVLFFGICFLLILISYRYRQALYRWMEKMNHTGGDNAVDDSIK